MVVSGQSRGRGETQHIDDNAADGMAYIVFLRRCAQVVTEKIRNQVNSDLWGSRYGENKFAVVGKNFREKWKGSQSHQHSSVCHQNRNGRKHLIGTFVYREAGCKWSRLCACKGLR